MHLESVLSFYVGNGTWCSRGDFDTLDFNLGTETVFIENGAAVVSIPVYIIVYLVSQSWYVFRLGPGRCRRPMRHDGEAVKESRQPKASSPGKGAMSHLA